MPVTWTEQPILSQFLVATRQKQGMPLGSDDASASTDATTLGGDDGKPKPLPKGVVLDKDGKPYGTLMKLR